MSTPRLTSFQAKLRSLQDDTDGGLTWASCGCDMQCIDIVLDELKQFYKKEYDIDVWFKHLFHVAPTSSTLANSAHAFIIRR